MRRNKVLLIVIILMIVLVVLLGGGLAFAYFFTDTFKSDKEMFLKYVAKNSEILEILKDEDIANYGKKQETTPYTSDGQFKTDITASTTTTLDNTTVNALQNCNISFTGSTDKANNYKYQNINVNYSDAESLNLEYIQNGDSYGAKINDVIPKFVMVENNNLKQWANTLGLTEEQIQTIPDKIDLNSMESTTIFTDEEKEQIKTRYQNILIDNLTDDMFSKSETAENDIYTLTLTEEQSINLICKLLETLKEDEVIWNKVKQILTENSSITVENANEKIQGVKDKIQEILDSKPTQADNNPNICVINVYVKSKNLVKTEVAVGEDLTTKITLLKTSNGMTLQYLENGEETPSSITIEKTKSTNEVTYKINIIGSEENQKVDLSINFNGINTLEQVQESYEFNVANEDEQYIWTYKNIKRFVNEIERKTIADEEKWLLNGHSAESITTLFEQIETAIEQKNTTQMNNIGLEADDNPMKYYLPTAIPLGIITVMQHPNNGAIYGLSAGILGGTSIAMIIEKNALMSATNQTVQESQSQIKEMELSAFNSSIMPYLGTNVRGSQVNSLIQLIISSNSAEIREGTSRYIKLTYPDSLGQQQTISVENGEIVYSDKNAELDVDNNAVYTIKCDYDENGYINEVIITKN